MSKCIKRINFVNYNSPLIDKKTNKYFSSTECNENILNDKIKGSQKMLSNQLDNSKNRKLRSKRNSISITPETSVFSLPYVVNDLRNKKKINYEKISNDLKNLFNIESKNKKISLSDNNDLLYDALDYINLIKKSPNERTMIDLYMIANYLSNSKLGLFFKDEYDNNKEIFEKLIIFLSVEIKHKKFCKGQKIFNIGDLPDYFYIILQGRIDILKPIQKKVNISGNHYFCYLMDLLRKGDNYTLNLCIEKNKQNFIIEKEDFKLLPYIFISINLEKINIDYPIDFSEILSIVNISPNNFDLKQEKCTNNDYIRENADKIRKKFLYKINSDLIEKYYFIFDKYEKHEILVYNNIKFLSLEANDYFGDSAFDSKTTRNATIIASEDTDVGYLEMDLYNSYIGEEKRKLIKKQNIFLLKNFFFNKINPKKFEKQYLGHFINCNYIKGDILFKENENPKYAYFIEEGMVELSTTKNIIEMQMTIEILQNKLNKMKTIIKWNQKKVDTENEDNNNEKNIEIIDKELFYNKVNSNFLYLIEHINRKEKNKVFLLKKNEDLGIISFYFDCPYITTCVVASNKAKIFKIDTKYLGEIMSNEKKCLKDLNKRVKYRLQLFQERFFNINNTKLLIADKKENHKKEEIINRENCITKSKILHKHDIIFNKLNKEKNKTIINVNKLKELYKKIIDKKDETNENNSLSNKNIKLTLPSIKSDKVFIINSNVGNNKIKSKSQQKELDRKNRAINRKITDVQKLKTIFIDKGNRNKIMEFESINELKKNINKKKNISFYKNDISSKIKRNNSNYNNNKSYFIDSENKKHKFKNDSFINYFEKYFNNNQFAAKTSLIFSKVFKDDEHNFKDDKLKKISNNKISDINNKESYKPNFFSFLKKFPKSSRNYNNFNFTNINFFLSHKNINISNDNSFKKIMSDKKFNHFNSETPITTNKNNVNSYKDKKIIIKKKNKKKEINHPYYSPSVLIKREKYKKFSNNELYMKNNRKGMKTDFFSVSTENKNISIYMSNSTNFKYKKIV